MTDSAGPALELRNVHHRFHRSVAVRDMSLSVSRGEVVCLLGPSGCGKTTTLRIAAGLEQPWSGEVLMDGKTVSGNGVMVPPEKRQTGLVFQDYALFPHMTNAQNVAFGLKTLSPQARAERVHEVLSLVGMEQAADKYPHTLSGGQQQRVALARALAPEPGIVLMDEPFSGLDARLRDRVRDETLRILKDAGTAVLMVTHDPEEAMFMGDRIAIMNHGRAEQLDCPEKLYLEPATAFVAEFLGDVNRLTGTVSQGQVETALGRFQAKDLEEGSTVELLFRPEAIQPGPMPGVAMDSAAVARATVLSARLLGRASLLRLQVEGLDTEIRARVPRVHLPEAGTEVLLKLDRSLVYLFPLEQADDRKLAVAAE